MGPPQAARAFQPHALQAACRQKIQGFDELLRIKAVAFKAIPAGKLVGDIINGGQSLREWMDEAKATAQDRALSCGDEGRGWISQRPQRLIAFESDFIVAKMDEADTALGPCEVIFCLVAPRSTMSARRRELDL